MSGAVAHPLVVPLPRLVPPLAGLVRRAVLARLRAMWSGGRLDIVLPTGERVRLGGRRGEDSAPDANQASGATVRVHDDRFFLRLLLRGELGGGEAFVAGEWSSDDLVAALRMFLRTTDARGFESPLTRLAQLPALVRHRRAANTRAGSERNIHAHYDLGNDFYRLFLDPETLAYSCAEFRDPAMSLADAQRAKLDRLCDLLALSPADHLLEIGCGWGGMAIHAARTRGCRVTALTISREQHALASARVADAGLADRVSIQYRDYRDLGRDLDRDLGGGFDKIVSIEMVEAVGHEHLPGFFHHCARVLRPGGALALQSITMPDERFATYRDHVDWMQTYIFPGSCIPSVEALARAATPAGFRLTGSLDIGPSYAPTLHAWRTSFLARLPEVRALGFDTPFIRAWDLYLAFSEAAFVEGTLGDHQLLFQR